MAADPKPFDVRAWWLPAHHERINEFLHGISESSILLARQARELAGKARPNLKGRAHQSIGLLRRRRAEAIKSVEKLIAVEWQVGRLSDYLLDGLGDEHQGAVSAPL